MCLRIYYLTIVYDWILLDIYDASLKCWLLFVNVQIPECERKLINDILFKYTFIGRGHIIYNILWHSISLLSLIILFIVIPFFSERFYISSHCHVTYLTPVKRIPIPASLHSDLTVWLWPMGLSQCDILQKL